MIIVDKTKTAHLIFILSKDNHVFKFSFNNICIGVFGLKNLDFRPIAPIPTKATAKRPSKMEVLKRKENHTQDFWLPKRI